MHHCVTGIVICHYDDVIMDTIASQITSLAIVYSIVYSSAVQRKHQSSASLAFVRVIHRGPVNSPHKGPVTRKMFPFDDVIMYQNVARKPLRDNPKKLNSGPPRMQSLVGRSIGMLFMHPAHISTNLYFYGSLEWETVMPTGFFALPLLGHFLNGCREKSRKVKI